MNEHPRYRPRSRLLSRSSFFTLSSALWARLCISVRLSKDRCNAFAFAVVLALGCDTAFGIVSGALGGGPCATCYGAFGLWAGPCATCCGAFGLWAGPCATCCGAFGPSAPGPCATCWGMGCWWCPGIITCWGITGICGGICCGTKCGTCGGIVCGAGR